MDAENFYEFLSDPQLIELIERAKTSDDILDVITLSENQHSDMLAWCLTPGEGHGLGDSVIKDFLEAGYHASWGAIYDNRKFFEKWTPGRIRASSFGAAFVTREFAIKIPDADLSTKKGGRLDLFLIDPQNKLLVAIENKVGAKLDAVQLENYQAAVNREIGGRPMFKGYEFAYVVLDRELEWYTEEGLKKFGKRWCMLDYRWLEASASRARLHVARNNQAAQLLVSYCQKQTDWESPSEQALSELAADIAERYPSVIGGLLELRGNEIPKWTPKTLDGHVGELTLFRAQNLRLCELLLRSRGIAALQGKIRKALPLGEELLQHGRIWLEFATSEMDILTIPGKAWALSINIFRPSGNDNDKPSYTVRVMWRNASLDRAYGDGQQLRAKLDEVLPGIKRYETAAVRRMVIARDLDATKALNLAVELANNLTKALMRKASAGAVG